MESVLLEIGVAVFAFVFMYLMLLKS